MSLGGQIQFRLQPNPKTVTADVTDAGSARENWKQRATGARNLFCSLVRSCDIQYSWLRDEKVEERARVRERERAGTCRKERK